MAGTQTQHYNGDPMFVSPDTLALDRELNGFREEDMQPHQQHAFEHHAPQSHHQAVWAQSQNQQHRPALSMPGNGLADWSFPSQQSFRPNLPPTPSSPFRPLRPLSEDEKLEFPCTGSPTNCWNSDLCPKHRRYEDQQQQQQEAEHLSRQQHAGGHQKQNQQQQQHHQHQSQPQTTPPLPEFSHIRPAAAPNSRRRSAPARDLEPQPTAKMKRNATSPEETDPENSGAAGGRRASQHRTLSIASRGRVPHNLVERRYRDNLNNQIETLRLVLPNLREAQLPCPTALDPLGLDDASGPRMPSKAVIISTAATYIKDLENERARLLDANKALHEQNASLQKLVRCEDCNVMSYLNAMQLNAAAAHLPTPS